MSNLLRVGSIVRVGGISFYRGMSENSDYIVRTIWNRDGEDIYSFQSVGKFGRGVGKSFSHVARVFDGSIEPLGRSIKIVKY